MAIAGKVAITPGGEWSVDVAYDKLVVVTYNNDLYLSKKANTGVNPTDEEHWQLLIKNVTQEQYDNIINGTTTVGNALQLGGKGASEYVQNGSSGFSTEIVYGDHNKPTEYGMPTLPVTSNYFIIASKHAPSNTVLTALAIGDNYTKNVYSYSSNNKEWERLTKEADLANYLPKSGGTLNGMFYFTQGDTGKGAVYKSNSTGTDYGTILRDYDADGNYSQLIIATARNQFLFRDKTGTDQVLYGTGNKPIGSYTGNGSAESRTIVTGGLGNAVKIVSELGYTVIITNGTSFGGNTTSYLGFDWNACHVAPDGNIVLGTAHEALNKSGIIYQYEYL